MFPESSFPNLICSDSCRMEDDQRQVLHRAAADGDAKEIEEIEVFPSMEGDRRGPLFRAAADEDVNKINDIQLTQLHVESLRITDANDRTILHCADQYACNAKMVANLRIRMEIQFFMLPLSMETQRCLNPLTKPMLMGAAKRSRMHALLHDERDFFDKLVAPHYVKITSSSIVKALILELIDKPEIQERFALFESKHT
ncbi:hypothetical protein KP509_03G098500 [Ceratopteris richardii]|uniref:Uncharacterized protein n=1 Tax=Ceratopteris richardii TaxID=49495 RepID=A0A8T2V631_CERRI|nr:hypothetical protein KP509_03G098500 [Ceratopteris richardii]